MHWCNYSSRKKKLDADQFLQGKVDILRINGTNENMGPFHNK